MGWINIFSQTLKFQHSPAWRPRREVIFNQDLEFSEMASFARNFILFDDESLGSLCGTAFLPRNMHKKIGIVSVGQLSKSLH